MTEPLLQRKKTHFVFWRPGPSLLPPELVIGVFKAGDPPTLDQRREIALTRSLDSAELWEVPAADCGLSDGQVYHYWFQVTDTAPFREPHSTLLCTDRARAGVSLGGEGVRVGVCWLKR